MTRSPHTTATHPEERLTRTTARVVFALYFGACLLALIWPVATMANRIEPRVLGLPFFFAWSLLWTLLVFLGVASLYAWEKRSGQEL